MKVRGKKKSGRVDTISSSFTLFQIELKTSQGGLISWGVECRFKHLGTGKYLALSKNEINGEWHMRLTSRSTDPDTVFSLQPVDKVKCTLSIQHMLINA